MSYVAHIGGLLALFLGASLITCLELIDVIIQGVHAAVRHLRTFAEKSSESESGIAHTTHVIVEWRPTADNNSRYNECGLPRDYAVNVGGNNVVPESTLRTTCSRDLGMQAETDI